MHRAYLRQVSSMKADTGESYVLSASHRKVVVEAPSVIFSSMSMSMCLALSKYLSKTDPSLFMMISQSLIDMLKSAGPLSLQNSGSELIVKSMASIIDFAEDVMANSTGGE
jgi:hypothetical protein